MALDPSYKNVTLRNEVREGCAFTPEELTVNRSRCMPYRDNV